MVHMETFGSLEATGRGQKWSKMCPKKLNETRGVSPFEDLWDTFGLRRGLNLYNSCKEKAPKRPWKEQ